ncbi:DNA polymerase III subunit gamma and tau [Williamsia sterculiae]|uniref:DNA polymerase III subunit gamma/tau n=1 Tax=Williamsia sterculiae TaxID=1344003 RepID=A0A1N7F6R7_9NOCA|nr:DNA polymerase III subunit gamma and tau [Williamsia sterculiae]SIR95999.1 DNA polymerase III, tau subunit [Williamsia sterculiae]
MALYRTYRPATFAEVVGQEHVTEPLSRALDGGRVNHAYLFSGPRGCGKTSSARILARSLNCEQGPTSTPCGVCDSCVALAPGGPGNLDVIEMDAASHGGVDDTRELRDRAFFAPSSSRYRVFIIDEAHMVTSAGFNALLKIVEEPPEHLIFIFATTEPEKVLPTIRSRTHHYPFRLLPPAVMRRLLESICGKEGVTVDQAVYPLIIRAGGGSPRDSLSVLDQLVAGADERGVSYDRALALLGVTDVALIDEAVDALAASDGAGLFGAVERVVEAGHDPRRFGVDLLDRLRDLILLQAVPDAGDRGLVEAPDDELGRMREQSERLTQGALTRFAEIAHASLGEMRGTTSPRLLLEVMCSRMLLPAASDSDSAVLQRLEKLEQVVAAGGVTSAAPPRENHTTVSTPAVSTPPTDAKFVRPSQRVQQDRVEDERVAREKATAETIAQDKAAQERAEQQRAEEAARATAAAEAAERDKAERERAERERAERERPAPQERVAEPDPVDEVPLPPEPMDEEPPEPVVDEISEPQPTPAPATDEADPAAALERVRKAWPEIRAAVRERDKVVEVMLSGAAVVSVDGDRVVLTHENAPLAARLSSPRGAGVLGTALAAVLGGDWEVRCDVGSAPPAPAAAPPQAADRQSRSAGFTRPSRGRDRADTTVTDDPPPEPEEPEPAEVDPGPIPDEDITDDDRAEMVAGAQNASPDERHDPDKAALKLLTDELGAHPIDTA